MEGFDYRMFKAGEDQGGAIMPSETAGSGLIVYFETDDIDASVAKVRELGGTADDKQPVPTHGWFASCKDTEGNELQSLAGRPERRVTSVAVALAVLAGPGGLGAGGGDGPVRRAHRRDRGA